MTDIDITRLRVLVIDDEAFMRTLVVRVLNELGITQVTAAEDGADALERLSTTARNFELIICDLEMPNMDGFAFVRELRSQPGDTESGLSPCADIPVLILTGHSEEDVVHDALGLGIHGYLVKPISRGALEARIQIAMTSPPIDPMKLKR